MVTAVLVELRGSPIVILTLRMRWWGSDGCPLPEGFVGF
jgi:hypothetical protein